MRLHVVTSSGELGGAELALATHLAHRPAGVDPRVTVVGPGPLVDRLRDLGLETTEHPGLAGRPRPALAARFAFGLARQLRRERAQVAWLAGQKAAVLAGPAARLAGVPAVWQKVDLTRDDRVARPLAALAGRVIAVSEAAAEALGPARERRLLGVVGPPVALPAGFRAAPDPAVPTIGTLGRLVPYKGHDRILRAAALVSEQVPDLRVILAGGPAPEHPAHPGELRALAAELGIADRVELPGFVDAATVLRRLTVFVNATHVDAQGYGREALSGAMLEASWAGVPVVAVAGGGTAEGLRDGVTGTLVAAADPALLARAIAPYLLDPAVAERTGDAAAAFARDRFAPEAAAARLFALLSASASR